MPKKIITKETLPLVLSEIDRWRGKLTWDLLRERLAEVLQVKSVSRHTLLNYPEIVDAFNWRKENLKEEVGGEPANPNVTIESLLDHIDELGAKINRLEKENQVLKEQFVRWQYNLYMMPGVDMERLNKAIDKPLVPINRRQ